MGMLPVPSHPPRTYSPEWKTRLTETWWGRTAPAAARRPKADLLLGASPPPSSWRPEPCQDRGPPHLLSCPRPLGAGGLIPPCATFQRGQEAPPVLPVEGRGLEQRACLQERDTCKAAGLGVWGRGWVVLGERPRALLAQKFSAHWHPSFVLRNKNV